MQNWELICLTNDNLVNLIATGYQIHLTIWGQGCCFNAKYPTNPTTHFRRLRISSKLMQNISQNTTTAFQLIVWKWPILKYTLLMYGSTIWTWTWASKPTDHLNAIKNVSRHILDRTNLVHKSRIYCICSSIPLFANRGMAVSSFVVSKYPAAETRDMVYRQTQRRRRQVGEQ